MCFSRGSLSISKYGPIVSTQHIYIDKMRAKRENMKNCKLLSAVISCYKIYTSLVRNLTSARYDRRGRAYSVTNRL